MTEAASPVESSVATASARDSRRTLPAVAVVAPTILLSAVLLFSAELLVGRVVLPVFGGGPGVWATVLAFFQAVLLLGYLYAHLSATRLGVARGAVIHAVLVVAAAIALAAAPVGLTGLRNQARPPELDLLIVLTVVIGPAAFVLTATTPLLSTWYMSIARRADGDPDPYWLYALSNLGSFGALLAYPLLVEPRLGLSEQRVLWDASFVVLGSLLLAGAVLVRGRGRGRGGPRALPGDHPVVLPTRAPEPIAGRRRVAWVMLAAVPAGLMAAVTNAIATDLISAPLLWVGPLAIYLLTFVVAFSRVGRRVVPRARWLAPVAITLMWVPFGSAGAWPIGPLLVLDYACFAVAALALHGRLAADRPDSSSLTEFYLLVALGGVLGGSFVAVVAPTVFPAIWEYPILLVAGLALLAGVTPMGIEEPARPGRSRRIDLRPFLAGAPGRLIPYGLVAAGLALALAPAGPLALEAGVRWLLVGGLVLLVGARPAFLATTTALVLAISVFVIPHDSVFQGRSFFGVSEVLRPAGESRTILMNGTTLHGVQSTDESLRAAPLSYYARSGPAGDVFRVVRADRGSASATGPGLSVGVVGLGAGSLAAYETAGDRMTFYEIDPVVVRIAEDPRFFTYLNDAPSPPSIVLGDARLSLGRVPPGSHDLLVLDAFSSDAIPAHLLTVEAFDEYGRVLSGDGTLAVHVSNRYYDLVGAVAAAMRSIGLEPVVRSYVPTPGEAAAGATPSVWVVGSRREGVSAGLAGDGWIPVGPGVAPLTDDFSDLLRFLRPGWW